MPMLASELPRYLPIADYAIVGDTRSAALISRDGSIDWLCWPRFDGRSIFARILDADRGGSFSIRPDGPFACKRQYIDGTNVLETTFTTESGVARLIDLMPVMREEEKRRRLTPFRQLLRRVEVADGEMSFVATYEPRPDYARAKVKLELRGDRVYGVQGPNVFNLRTNAPFVLESRSTARARFALRRGEHRDFALAFDSHAPAVFPHVGDEATAEIQRTIDFWREWSSQLKYDGPWRDSILRSALVLKLLTYAPSGAIVAAPTTSLPEAIGSVRNWDYRYCWLRDAAFTVAAMEDCGFEMESGAFVSWLVYSTRLTQPSLQILYDVFGESRVPEATLDHLEGYARSAPVRIGNEAHDQFQLDVYGEVLGAVEERVNRADAPLSKDVQKLLVRLAAIVVKRWKEPDSGIWEKRSGRHQHVHAKIMAWAALDCAERLASRGSIDSKHVDLWKKTKAQIRDVVLTRGFNKELNSFVSELDGNELDASLLYAARVGLLPATDPRMLGTIDAIRRSIGRDDLVYRYPPTTDDGLPAGEGAFLPCSFWLVEALALAGRDDEASELFDKLLKRSNDVGLLSEEADPDTGALLGNFPQALTHIGLINAAMCLHKRRGRASRMEGKA